MPRLPGLDLMRTIAIVWVLLYHGIVLGLGTPLPAIAPFGWMGVDLFFVLSGYLIGAQRLAACLPDRPAPLGEFYLRRAFRILPAYAVVVAVYFLLPDWRERPSIQPWWQFATFTENLLIDFSQPKAFSHVWSLCVEEHFYLLFPVLAWLMLRRPSARKAAGLCLAIVVAGMAWRGYVWLHDLAQLPDNGSPGNLGQRYYERIYYPTWTHLDGLLAGVTLALIKVYRPGLWQGLLARPQALLAAGSVLLGVSIWLFQDQFALAAAIVGYPMLSLAWALIVASSASPTGWLGRYRLPGTALIATLAYSLYLSHKLVFHAMKVAFKPVFTAHGGIALLAYAGSALAVAALLYLGVERPFLRWRNRLLQTKTAQGEWAVSATA